MKKGLLPLDEALQRMLEASRAIAETESVATLDAAGRVLAQGQRSGMDVPSLDNSAMDGYAVRHAEVPAAGTRLRVSQRIAAGTVGAPLEQGTAARIFTGAPVPPGADAVVMQEHCRLDGDHVVIDVPPLSGQWVRRQGSDISAGSDILEAGVRLRAQDVGLAASVGIASLPVFRRIRVALFFTGDELVMPGEALPPGRIYNSNRFTLFNLARGIGCEVRDYGIVPDDLDATRDALRRAAVECDVIVTSGGVSVGEADFVKPAVEAEGSLLMWRLDIKPGRPLAFGRVGNSAFIGLPGNPVSSFVTFLLVVRPFLMRTQGIRNVVPRVLQARADFDWLQPDTRREFLRTRWNGGGGLDLYPTQDSAVLTSTTWADGLVDTAPGQVIHRGDSVRFLAFSELQQ